MNNIIWKLEMSDMGDTVRPMCCAPWRLGAILILMLTSSGIVSRAAGQTVTDRVQKLRGAETGEVTDMSRFEVTLRKRPQGSVRVGVHEIKNVMFGDEPPELNQARVRAANGGYREAVEILAKIDASAIQRAYVKQELDFWQAYSAAQLALAGQGTIKEAGTQLNNFVRAYPQNFRNLAAIEAMGDLLAADGRFDLAQTQYNELAKAPFPEYKLRAAVAIGRALAAQGNHAGAIEQFDGALAIAADSPGAKAEKLAATLGKAVSLSETDLKAAVASIEQVILDADPEQKELHARAYNALGRCYEQAGQTRDALLAFLHVDLLYNTSPDAHAEALSRLAPLWQAVGQDGEARAARQKLHERYAGTRWAK